MKKIILLGILGVLMFLPENGFPSEWQFWNNDSVEGKLTDRIKIKFENEMRFGNNKGFFYNHIDTGLGIKTLKWLTVGINFRGVFEKKDNAWTTEARPHANIAFHYTIWKLNIENRNRLEFRFKEGKDLSYRYRNKLTIELPTIGEKVAAIPYLSDEIFYDLSENEFTRNRLYAGIKIKAAKNINAEIFYLLQTDKKERWENTNVVGVNLKFLF